MTAYGYVLLDVARIVDLEQAGIGPLAVVEVGNGNRGVVALRVGDRPLLQLKILGADHHHQPAGADERLRLFDGKGHERVVGTHAYDVRLLQEVDTLGEKKAQRRLRERIKILRGQLAVAYHDRLSIGDDLDSARLLVVEANFAGLLDVKFALDAAAVGTDLDKIADQLLDAGKIGADLVDLRALGGIETGGGRRRCCGGFGLALEMEERFQGGSGGLRRRAGSGRGRRAFLRERRGRRQWNGLGARRSERDHAQRRPNEQSPADASHGPSPSVPSGR